MKKIEVELEGVTPLLMHSAENMQQKSSTKNPAKDYDPVIQAENVAYRTGKGHLYVPARCLKAAILNAASWFKFGKKSAKQIIAGCTRIEPYELVLTDENEKVLKEYEIDQRPVVVQRARIIRSRPRLDKWKLKFNLVYNEDLIGTKVDMLRQILEEAGQRIGLLDNRPQKYGECGTFIVTKFMPAK